MFRSSFRTPLCAFFIFLFAYASDIWSHDNAAFSSRSDGHAPIGVMGEHAHKTGEWMISYRFMHMKMDTLYSGNDEISAGDVHSDYIISPTEMTMEMHMLGAMYAPNDALTFMIMLPYAYKSMDHIRRTDSAIFTARSRGIGDITLSGIYNLLKDDNQKLLLNFGVSLPTGSINKKDVTLAGPDDKLALPMQLGTGTHDILPGITYVGHNDDWSWGGQLRSRLHIGVNKFKYTLGNQLGISSWLAYSWQDWLSTSVRVDGQLTAKIKGRDEDKSPSMMINTTDPDNSGGKRLDLLFGINLFPQEGFLAENRLAFEIGFPVYQNLNGKQLGTDLIYTIGYQRAF